MHWGLLHRKTLACNVHSWLWDPIAKLDLRAGNADLQACPTPRVTTLAMTSNPTDVLPLFDFNGKLSTCIPQLPSSPFCVLAGCPAAECAVDCCTCDRALGVDQQEHQHRVEQLTDKSQDCIGTLLRSRRRTRVEPQHPLAEHTAGTK